MNFDSAGAPRDGEVESIGNPDDAARLEALHNAIQADLTALKEPREPGVRFPKRAPRGNLERDA